MSDLTGRAEELEREATELRRENGWLKEIVMLKGGRLTGMNLLRPSAGPSGSSGERSGPRREDIDEAHETDSDDPSYEEKYSRRTKGKGKSRG